MKLTNFFCILASVSVVTLGSAQVNNKSTNAKPMPKSAPNSIKAKPMPKSAPSPANQSMGVTAYKYGFAGCGLGSYLPNSSQQEDKIHQLIAAIINQWGVQTFALSTGTSNCDDRPQSAVRMEREVFVAANLAVLQKETAQGNGPALTAFADLLGCQPEAASRFSEMSQQNYQNLFAVPEPKQVLQKYLEQVNQSDDLSKVCTRVFI